MNDDGLTGFAFTRLIIEKGRLAVGETSLFRAADDAHAIVEAKARHADQKDGADYYGCWLSHNGGDVFWSAGRERHAEVQR